MIHSSIDHDSIDFQFEKEGLMNNEDVMDILW